MLSHFYLAFCATLELFAQMTAVDALQRQHAALFGRTLADILSVD